MKNGSPRKGRPAVRRSQAERTALSDQRIVSAAIRLLAERGVEGATIQAIAALAGYDHSLLVHRYGGKTGLLMRVMDKVTADWQALVAQHIGQHRGIDALGALLGAHIAFIETEPDEIIAMYRLWFHVAAPGEEYRRRLAHTHRKQRETVTDWLRLGLERGELRIPHAPRVFAERFCATISGLMYQWITDPELPIVSIYRSMQSDLQTGQAALPAVTRTDSPPRAQRVPRNPARARRPAATD